MDWTSTTGVALLSSVVGAGSALVGVLLTSCFNAFIQWRQRKHDAGQKAMDRIAILRREVYLEATTLCVAAINQLPYLTQGGDEAERAKTLSGVSLAMAKVQMVCSPTTAIAAQAYNAEFASVFQKLLLAAQKARRLEIDIGIQDDWIAGTAKEMGDVTEMMRQYNLAQRADQGYYEMLIKMHTGAMSRHKKLTDEANALHDERAKALGIYQRAMYPELSKLNGLQRKLLDCVRDELGLPPQPPEDVAKRLGLEAATLSQASKLSDALAKDGFQAFDVPASSAAPAAPPQH